MTNKIDPRTSRPFGDHGTEAQAMDFASENLGDSEGDSEIAEFLRDWRDGTALTYWPEFYDWLREQEAGQ